MTAILCNWLNDDVKLSKKVDSINFCSAFSSGYLIGEVLHKYQLQDDFDQFSHSTTAEARLNNFTRLEPSLHLLGLHFDTNTARDIMTEKHNSATNLMYQLYIALNNKKKANLTSVAMETMMPAAPARLHHIGNLIYRERLKQLTPRQTDLSLSAVSDRFHDKQIEMEKVAFRERFLSEEQIKIQMQKQREILLEKSRQLRLHQSEMMAKIQSCKVNIPKTPPNRTVKALEKLQQQKRQKEAKEALKDISKFDQKMKSTTADSLQTETSIFIQTNENYISQIRKRLEEDKYARAEREKRRRKVVVDQQRAQDLQWLAHRDEVLVKRGLRQTQQERKIVVQLLQTRLQKNVILNNRIIREKQYEERREREFLDAMNREAELLQLAKEQYKDQIQKDIELHERIKAERKAEIYHKHYEMSFGIVLQMIDFACRICDFRAISDRSLLTQKVMREWKALFVSGQSLYDEPIEQVGELPETDQEIEETKLQLLDEEDFKEYKDMCYEWSLPEDVIKPKDNSIIGHIVARLLTLMNPPTPPPEPPVFPKFPIRACILGKVFSGKTSCISKLIQDFDIAVLNIDVLVKETIEAYKNKELEMDTSCESSLMKLEASAKDFNSSEQTASQLQKTASYLTSQDVLNEQITSESESNPVVNHQDIKSKTFVSQSLDSTPHAKLSNKAILGQKICESLKQGKNVEDQVLIEVVADAIRNIPEENGWVLDGFPVTYSQTKALEKSLSGIDAVKTGLEPFPLEEKLVPKSGPKDKKLKKSKLIPDPTPRPPSPEPDSGLDAVILLDLPDDLCLKRAAGQFESVETGEKYHILFNPPPLKDVSKRNNSQNIVPLQTETFDEENAQCRLMTYLENWPDMERWFERFGNLYKIDATPDIDSVYKEMRRVFEEAYEKKKAKEKAAEEEPVPEVVNEVTEPITAAEETVAETLEITEEEGEKIKEEPIKALSMSHEGSIDSGVSKKSKHSPQKTESRSPKESKKQDSVSPKEKNVSRRAKASVSEPEPEVEIPVVPNLPAIVPGCAEWIFVDTDINMEIAIQLASYWEAIENTYIDNCKKILREIRSERDSIKPYFHDIKCIFLEYLQRPDNKQDFINQWQKEYNDIPDDIRFDEETQTEIHQTVDDLRETLWNICDEQKQQAEAECQAIMNNGWYEDRLGKLCNNYITLMQIEIDCFQNTIHLLKDYYKISDKQIPPQPELNYSRLPLIEIFNTKIDIHEGSAQKDAANADGKKLTPKKKPGTPDAFVETESIGSQGTKGSQDPKTPKEKEKSSRERTNSRSPSAKQVKKGKEKEKEKEEDKQNELIDPDILAVRLKIPLITPTGTQFLSPDGAPRGDGKKVLKEGSLENQLGADMNEKGILEAYQSVFQQALNEVANMMNAEQTAREIEEEEERLKELEKEKGRLTAEKKKGKKNKKGSASSKKGKKDEDLTPSPAIEMSEEERNRQAMKEKIKQEFYFALEEEEITIKSRLQLIKIHSLEYVVKELHKTADNAYKPMNDWIGAKFLRQMESIDQMTEVVKNAIENGQKLKNEVLLLQEDFYIDKGYKVLRSPIPPPPPGFVEYHPEQMTCTQLSDFLTQFYFTAPSGIMASKSFQDTLEDLVCTAKGSDALPNLWMSTSLTQIQQNICTIAKTLSSDTDYIDWRQFLLCAIYPFVEFSEESLYRLFVSYFEVDTNKTGYINYDQYNSVELWTDEETIKQNAGYGFDRSKKLKKVFFDLFSEADSDPRLLDYEKMLLYFCATYSVTNGFIRALSLASLAHMMKSGEPLDITGNQLPINIPEKSEQAKSPLESHKSKLLLTSQESEELAASVTPSQVAESSQSIFEQNYIKTALDQMIPIEALFKVLHHGEVTDGRFHRMNENCDPVDVASMERLVSAYIELGSKDAGPLHYAVLIEHPLIQDLMHRSQFLLMDIKSMLSASANTDADNSRKWK